MGFVINSQHGGSGSEFNLDGSERAPSDASAVLRSPSVASDGVVHIGEDEEHVVITISDDEEEEEDNNSVIEISSDEEGESEDDTSELELGGEPEENEDEEEEEIAEPQVHRFYGKIRIKQSVLDRHAEEDANRPPCSPNLSLSSGHDDRTIDDPDRTISEPPSPLRLINENEDEEMVDDGIVDFQPLPYVPYNNRAPSHFTRAYRGVTTIWSFADWADEEEEVLAEEAAERERERLQRRRWASNGGRSRLSRQRAFRRR
ncbi:hypothetical protein IFR05_007634 [Cadophora sp. M221]|nr:hypothetical protein IFR05_007634 [Cadophora sp. M221]